MEVISFALWPASGPENVYQVVETLVKELAKSIEHFPILVQEKIHYYFAHPPKERFEEYDIFVLPPNVIIEEAVTLECKKYGNQPMYAWHGIQNPIYDKYYKLLAKYLPPAMMGPHPRPKYQQLLKDVDQAHPHPRCPYRNDMLHPDPRPWSTLSSVIERNMFRSQMQICICPGKRHYSKATIFDPRAVQHLSFI